MSEFLFQTNLPRQYPNIYPYFNTPCKVCKELKYNQTQSIREDLSSRAQSNIENLFFLAHQKPQAKSFILPTVFHILCKHIFYYLIQICLI